MDVNNDRFDRKMPDLPIPPSTDPQSDRIVNRVKQRYAISLYDSDFNISRDICSCVIQKINRDLRKEMKMQEGTETLRNAQPSIPTDQLPQVELLLKTSEKEISALRSLLNDVVRISNSRPTKGEFLRVG